MDFYDNLSAFRKYMGLKSWWKLPKVHHDAALNALGFLYLRTPFATLEETEQAALALDATIQEYEMRALMMIFRGN
jgi:hypothetical protein